MNIFKGKHQENTEEIIESVGENMRMPIKRCSASVKENITNYIKRRYSRTRKNTTSGTKTPYVRKGGEPIDVYAALLLASDPRRNTSAPTSTKHT